MSSIAAQLQKIRKSKGVEKLQIKYKDSYLFDNKVAADYDLDTIYSIGKSGLESLKQYEKRFANYEKTLFSLTMKNINRAQQTNAENDKLDESINMFLRLLSPHFLDNAAGKALEWLIRRYKINVYNIDGIMECILPYHETAQFLNMVSILKLEEGSTWYFLKSLKAPLDRKTLVQRCVKDRAVIQKLYKMVHHSIRNQIKNTTLWITNTLVSIQYLQSLPQIQSDILTFMLPVLIECAKTKKHQDLQLSAYMIICQICNISNLTINALSGLMEVIARYTTSDLTSQSLMTLVRIFQSQEVITTFPKSTFEYVSKFKQLEEHLDKISETYNTEKFVKLFINCLIENSNEKQHLSFLFKKIVSTNKIINDNITKEFCHTLLKQVLTLNHNGEELSDHFKNMISFIQARFSSELHSAIQSIFSTLSEEDKKILYDMSTIIFKGTQYQMIKDDNTSIFLGLQSPEISIRLMALEKLIKIINSKQANKPLEYIEEVIVDTLHNDEDAMVSKVLEIPNLTKYVEKSKLNKALSAIIFSTKLSIKSKVKAISLFTEIDKSIEQLLFSFLLYTFKTCDLIDISLTILTSNPSTKSLVQGVNKVLGEKAKSKKQKITSPEIISDIVNQIANNMIKNKKVLEEKVPEFIEALTKNESKHLSILVLLLLSRIIYLLQNDPSTQYKIILQCLDVILSFADECCDNKLNEKYFVINEEKEGTISSSLGQEILKDESKNSNKLFAYTIFYTLNSVITYMAKRTTENENEKENEKETIAWLGVESDMSENANKAKTILTKLFLFFFSGKMYINHQAMITKMFDEHIKNDSIPCACSFWIKGDFNIVTRLSSLFMTGSCINSYCNVKPLDFQLVVPNLLITLMNKNKEIRQSGLQSFKAIQDNYSKLKEDPKAWKVMTPEKIFKYDIFYGGSSSHLQYLESEDISEFVDDVLKHQNEFIADVNYIEDFITDRLQKNDKDNRSKAKAKNSLLEFLLTNILVVNSVYAKVKLLQLLKNIDSSNKIKILYPLLESTLKELKNYSGEIKTREIENKLTLVKLLVNCFTIETLEKQKYLKLFINLFSYDISSEKNAFESDVIPLIALNILTPEFYDALTTSKQQILFSQMIYLIVNGEHNLILKTKEVIKTIKIQAEHVINELTSANSMETEQQQQRAKKSKKDNNQNMNRLNYITAILELLNSKAKIVNAQLLIPVLFNLLSILNTSEMSYAAGTLEYLKQLTLDALLEDIRDAKAKNIVINESSIRIEIIVNCIRVTDNPQTHNYALLLMAEIASIYPDRVLLNIMPVFTFMGANILRQDDNFSFHVIKQTLETIIPPLVEKNAASATTKEELDVQMKSVIGVFIDALIHIPKHRRLRLFEILVSTLGVENFLDTIIILLLEKHVIFRNSGGAMGKTKMENNELENIPEFCISLANCFDAVSQIKTVLNILKFTLQLPNEKIVIDEEEEEDATTKEKVENSLINVTKISSKMIRQFKMEAIHFVGKLLSSESFLGAVAMLSNENEDYESILEPTILAIVEVLIKLINNLSAYNAKITATKFWKILLKTSYSVLDKVNNLLSLHSILNVILDLLKNENPLIRRKAAVLLNDKILSDNDKHDYTEEEMNFFVPTIEELGHLLMTENDKTEDGAINKQTILLCITTLTQVFSKREPKLFMSILNNVINHCITSDNLQVCASSIVCITSVCRELGPRLVPFLPKFMPILLEKLEGTLKEEEEEEEEEEGERGGNSSKIIFQLSAISSLEIIVQSIPQFISSYLKTILTCALHPSLRMEDNEMMKQIMEKDNNLIESIGIHIPARVMVNNLIPMLNQCKEYGRISLEALFQMTEIMIVNIKREELSSLQKAIFKFFQHAFEIRETVNKDMMEEDIEMVEEVMIDTFMKLVMRMNESMFKPVYVKILEWSTSEFLEKQGLSFDVIEGRSLILYKIIVKMFDNLKSLFVHYFGNLMDFTIEKLEIFAQTENEDFGSTWKYVILALSRCFLYDNEGFMNIEKFDRLYKPLVNQMLIKHEDIEEYREAMNNYLVPCLGELAVNVKNEDMWKSLNKQVMMQSRDENPEVRIISLKVLEEFYKRLGEEFLILLPETVPFLAELMEDDNEEVEKLTQKVLNQIQQYLGEDISKYFQ
ncbi:ARM repeat-containing protein [Anaeromyces robustus]|uniref:U3 small nucleolar RNA-associated protein 10 n=1 Tax=Anaeromyces robustus TaxID=1754192 RepID=A0A1Y1X5K8_9FUNG|nr:ARM repeat-containing protein [Anaeromyces robustus]|eukprot:ORX81097.1 ARM repeat-containing protein [Anaeromyces robustus]